MLHVVSIINKRLILINKKLEKTKREESKTNSFSLCSDL